LAIGSNGYTCPHAHHETHRAADPHGYVRGDTATYGGRANTHQYAVTDVHTAPQANLD